MKQHEQRGGKLVGFLLDTGPVATNYRILVAIDPAIETPVLFNQLVKNTATLALQLLKHFRNICYASYAGRIPPSVMLSYYAGLAAQPNMSLSAMLVRLASWIIRDIEQASLYGWLLHVANPVCATDVFTDRWPDSIVGV